MHLMPEELARAQIAERRQQADARRQIVQIQAARRARRRAERASRRACRALAVALMR